MAVYLGWPYPAHAITVEKSTSDPGRKYLVCNRAVGMPRSWSREQLPEPGLYPQSTRPIRSSTTLPHGVHLRFPLIPRRRTNRQAYHHPEYHLPAAMELPLVRTVPPHTQTQPSFRAAAIRLDRTLRNAISFFTILRTTFESETHGLRGYAAPNALTLLWRNKLAHSNRHSQNVNPDLDPIHSSENGNCNQSSELHTFDSIRRDLSDHCRAFCNAVITEPGNPAFFELDRATISEHAANMTNQQRQDAHTLQERITPRAEILSVQLTQIETSCEILRALLYELRVLNNTLQVYRSVWTEKVDEDAANQEGDQVAGWR